MKIVLDTNVLINGFKDEYSYEKKIIDAVIAGEIEAFANKQTLRENRLISSELIDSDEYQKDLDNFFAQINWVVNLRQIHAVRDSEDNKILESAVQAGADFLITSDNDLLSLNEYQKIKIINPAPILGQVQRRGDGFVEAVD
jgi:uncharacterized protein